MNVEYEERDRIENEVKEQLLMKGFLSDGRRPDDPFDWREGPTLLAYLKRQSDGSKVFMKIPLHDRCERVVDATYKVHKLIPDKRNIEPVIGDHPVELRIGRKTYQGILLERAKFTLSGHMSKWDESVPKMSSKKRGDELLGIIIEASRGLKKAHDHAIWHKDIKESNIMLYPQGWGIGDFGFSSISNFIDTREASSNSIHQMEYYLDYELFRNRNPQERNYREFNASSDIFSLGAILFAGTDPEHHYPLLRFKNDVLGYNAQNVIKIIQESSRSEKMKYLLVRMLGERLPNEVTAEDEKKRYRYSDIKYFLAEAGSEKVVFKTVASVYDLFLQENEKFKSILNKEKHSTETEGLVKDISIDRIVRAYESMVKTYDSSGASSSLEMQKLRSETDELYYGLRYDQEKKIDAMVQTIRSGKDNASRDRCIQNLRDLHIFKNKTYLWGPPFTNAKRNNPKEKARYTYEEIRKNQTFYYDDFKKRMDHYNK